jgi:hypothetical protein
MRIGRRASVVDMATKLQTVGYGVRMPVAERSVLFSINFQTGSDVHAATCSVGIGVLSLELKRPGREAYHSLCEFMV